MTARILVVEDDALLALDLAQQLQNAGFEIVGPVAATSAALELLRTRGCDAGVLDIHLGRETSEPVARELIARGTPFVTVTGYSGMQRPPIFADAPLLPKPVRIDALVNALKRALGQNA